MGLLALETIVSGIQATPQPSQIVVVGKRGRFGITCFQAVKMVHAAATGVLNNLEYRMDVVQNLYQTHLHRSADPSG
jgi:hypothetical protein